MHVEVDGAYGFRRNLCSFSFLSHSGWVSELVVKLWMEHKWNYYCLFFRLSMSCSVLCRCVLHSLFSFFKVRAKSVTALNVQLWQDGTLFSWLSPKTNSILCSLLERAGWPGSFVVLLKQCHSSMEFVVSHYSSQRGYRGKQYSPCATKARIIMNCFNMPRLWSLS